MLKKHVKDQLCKNLSFNPTAGQELLMEKLAVFIVDSSNNSAFLLKGYAGTGKNKHTQFISENIEEF